MTEYWLALTLCFAAAHGAKVCEMRLAPMPLPGPVECQRLAAMIMRAEPSYQKPMLCSTTKPDLLPMTAPVGPWRWS